MREPPCPVCDDTDPSQEHATWLAFLAHEAHFSARLVRCNACQRQFVNVVAETVRFSDGGDVLDTLCIPVSDAEALTLVAIEEDRIVTALAALPPRRHRLNRDVREGAVWIPPHD
jgi:hypothetical protein